MYRPALSATHVSTTQPITTARRILYVLYANLHETVLQIFLIRYVCIILLVYGGFKVTSTSKTILTSLVATQAVNVTFVLQDVN